MAPGHRLWNLDPSRLRRLRDNDAQYTALRGRSDIVALQPNLIRQVDEIGPVATDGRLAIVTRVEGRPAQAFMMDGMYLDIDGDAVIAQPESGTYTHSW